VKCSSCQQADDAADSTGDVPGTVTTAGHLSISLLIFIMDSGSKHEPRSFDG
jgi:hypothetical protein